jgi:predicted nucleic acid-binding protein
MAFVADASMVAAWLMPDEQTPETDALLDLLRDAPALAPDLLRHEIRSLFLAAVKRQRVRESFLPWAMQRFNQLPLRYLGPGDDHAVLTLARVRQLSAYDAAYLALAIGEGAALATLDRKLAAAARLENVPLLGPLAGP